MTDNTGAPAAPLPHALRSALAALDDNASTDQLAAALVKNAVLRASGGPIADSRAIAEVFGKRHADVLRSIDTIRKAQPELERNFAFMQEVVPTHNGGHRTRRYFVLDRTAFNVLVLGFTGDRALRYRVAFVKAFEWLAENERRQHWGEVSSWRKGGPDALTPAQRAAIAHKEARQRALARPERGPDDIF